MANELAFFINQGSGSGRAPALATEMEGALPGLTIRKALPESASGLTQACSELDAGRVRAAIVFGGDGTQTYALRGLLQNEIPLYPFPSGTANDLASEQGITGCRTQFKQLLEAQSIEQVRVLEVNGIPFSTVAGIGIGAELCQEYNSLRANYGVFKKASQRMNCEIYSVLAMKQILRGWGKGHRVRITHDGGTQELTLSSLMVCNQSTLAGNLKVAPEENKLGNSFTLLIHPGPCGVRTVKGLASMKRGKIDGTFIQLKSSSLRIESLDGLTLPVFGDGEILDRAQTLEFKVHSKRLRIFKAKA
jgi:diacylglycerol kinase family enzyme